MSLLFSCSVEYIHKSLLFVKVLHIFTLQQYIFKTAAAREGFYFPRIRMLQYKLNGHSEDT